MSDMLPETYGQGYQYEDNAEFASEVTGRESESQAEGTTDTQETESNAGVNPAWNEMLSSVPEEFHPHLISHLDKMDKGVQQRFTKVQQQFSPYKEFAELNVPTQDIQQALQIYHAMNTQPKSVWEMLGNQFNFGAEQKPGPAAEEQVEDYDLNEENDLTKNPQFKALADKLSGAEQFIQNIQKAERQAEVNKSVDAEAAKVLEAFPDIDMAAVATFAIGQSNQTNKLPDLMAAATYLDSLIPKARVSDTAPPVIRAGNRGVPQNAQKKFGDMTSDEKTAYVLARASASEQ